jgi:hypothetical protein
MVNFMFPAVSCARVAVLALVTCVLLTYVQCQKAVSVQLRAQWQGSPLAWEALEFMVRFLHACRCESWILLFVQPLLFSNHSLVCTRRLVWVPAVTGDASHVAHLKNRKRILIKLFL